MKRIIAGMLILSLTMGLISGCSPNKKVQAGELTQEEVTQVQKEQQKLQEEREAQEAAENIEADEQLDLSMLSIQSDSDIDYTSVAGLNLEAGSHIAVVVKSTKSSYWDSVKKGMEQAVKDLNAALRYKGSDKIQFTFEAPGDENDVESQINTIDAVLSENPSALCLAAIDRNSCEAQLETAVENGIPVIILDSGVNSDLPEVVCETDNYTAAAEAARKLAEAVGESGTVGIAVHNPSSQASTDREQGFRDEMAASHTGVSVMTTYYDNEEESIADMVRAAIEMNPELKGFFCTSELMAEQVLEAVSAYPQREIQVVGFDAGSQQKKAIAEGRELGTIVQNTYGMGYASVVAAARAVLELPNAEEIDPGYQWIDAGNIEEGRYQKYIYD